EQDVPMLLSETPGVYAYSDNGNGVGYSYLSIRGFSQRRVSVMINGVPLNDPESHEVYWIDLPDLPENLQDAQIQRGVGTTLYGSNSIGGTINLLTDHFSPVREISVSSGVGSYNTRKFSAAVNSGMLSDRYTAQVRLSRVLSDGYRDDAWTDLWSWFGGLARYDEKWTNRVNVFGGWEETHLAYKGLPRRFIEGDTSFVWEIDDLPFSPTGDPDVDRRTNPLSWDGEVDHFVQPHFQWIAEYRPNEKWQYENTAYLILGNGYYDQLRWNTGLEEYQIDPFTIETESGRVEIDEADSLIRRRTVENVFWGNVAKLTRRDGRSSLTVGAEWRHLSADHYAELKRVVPTPPDFTPGQRYYDYHGGKKVISGFVQEIIAASPWVTITGALQASLKQYELRDDQFPNYYGQRVNHSTWYSFLSPRIGITLRDPRGWTVFVSLSHNEQEPTNDEVFDPQDFWSDANAFFRHFNPTTGEGEDPIMKPERVTNWEWGIAYDHPRLRAEANLFHMRFTNEIVYNGQINDDGVPIRANAPRSYHQGVELSARADFGRGVTASGNLAFNDNRFADFTEFVIDWDTWEVSEVNRGGNVIAGFPKHLANLRVNYDHEYFGVSGHLFRSGRLYIDNTNAKDASIDPYWLVSLRGELRLASLTGWRGLSAFVQVNNLFDEEYETGGYFDDGYPLFIPAAKRNVFAGLRAAL
ncbi:MAG TPA: TonB-dependent receptor, partial [Acidobacteriota bacterium]|nr:TonB-dependent receptor [Acidobacteriota bacterium]